LAKLLLTEVGGKDLTGKAVTLEGTVSELLSIATLTSLVGMISASVSTSPNFRFLKQVFSSLV
jgi:hypothetical protein